MARPQSYSIRIRDPIHGTMQLQREEIALIDSAAYQRLRMIKQLGLADLAFPGATHTHYTLKLLVGSELTRRIEERLTPDYGVLAEDVASLVAGRAADERTSARFRSGGHNFLPLMRQLVSSELDADRMDYLLRDS